MTLPDQFNYLYGSGAIALANRVKMCLGGQCQQYEKIQNNELFEVVETYRYFVRRGIPAISLRLYVSAEWRRIPPEVFVSCDWLRVGLDWHVYKDNSICWDHSERWKDRVRIACANLDDECLYEHLAKWILDSSRFLLLGHLESSELGLDKLPDSFLGFSHGLAGTEQYMKERGPFIKALRNQFRTKIKSPIAPNNN